MNDRKYLNNEWKFKIISNLPYNFCFTSTTFSDNKNIVLNVWKTNSLINLCAN